MNNMKKLIYAKQFFAANHKVILIALLNNKVYKISKMEVNHVLRKII